MSGSMLRSASPVLRKRPRNSPVLGEWTCFTRRGELLVLLGDVARINDKSLLKDCISFSINAFVTLWSQVGYQLSHSEEGLIENATIAKELMVLLPFNDAVEFVSQHLMRPAKLFLRTFNPILKGTNTPTTETIEIEPQSDDEGASEEHTEGDCNVMACEEMSSTDVEGNTCSEEKRSSKRRSREVNGSDCGGGNEDSTKKRKTGNSDDCCPHTDDIFLQSVVTFTKAFMGKKQREKEGTLKQLEEEKQARKIAEERLQELEAQFKRQLQKEMDLRKAKEEEVKMLQDELQMWNNKRQALQDKLQGINQFLQVDQDRRVAY